MAANVIHNRYLACRGPTSKPVELSIRLYSTDEIRRMSVCEITTPHTFDPLGHPNRGGLHDALMGPTERMQKCATCEFPEMQCPGHMGHINLPVVVYHPLFFRLTFQLIRCSCIECDRLVYGASSPAGLLLMAQLRCLDRGLLESVDDLRQIAWAISHQGELNDFAEETKKRQSRSASIAATAQLTKAIDEYLKEKLMENDNESHGKVNSRNVIDMKNQVVMNYFREYIYKKGRKCPHCGKNLLVVNAEQSHTIMAGEGLKTDTSTGSKRSQVKTKKPPLSDDEDNNPDNDDCIPLNIRTL